MRRALLLLAIAAAAVAQPIPSGSPTGPAGGAASGSYPNICLAGITCGTVVPTMNCSPGVTSDYLNTATATRYYCSATNAWTVGQSVAGNLSVSNTLSVITANGTMLTEAPSLGSVPLGQIQIYRELAPAPQTNYPLGHDLALFSKSQGDLLLENLPLQLTSTTSVSPGTTTVTVGSTTLLTTVAGNSLTVDANTANEEVILSGNWSIASPTTITALFAKSHTQPYEIGQYGAVFLSAQYVKVIAAGAYNGALITDSSNNPTMFLPSNLSASWPLGGLQVGATMTGYGGNLKFRNYDSTHCPTFLNSTNTTVMFSTCDSGIVVGAPIAVVVASSVTGAIINGTGGSTGFAPSLTGTGAGLLGQNAKTLGSGTGKVYGTIGVASGIGDVTGDRAYGGWFKAGAAVQNSTEVGLHAETSDTTGATMMELVAGGSTKLRADGALTSTASTALCTKADGITIGHCSSVVGAGGGCTCGN